MTEGQINVLVREIVALKMWRKRVMQQDDWETEADLERELRHDLEEAQ